MNSLSNRTQYHNRHDHVVHQIGQQIVEGRIEPGDVLPNVDALMATFNVSRTVIREALKTLTAKGMLESRPKIGTRVRPSDEWSPLDPDIFLWKYQSGVNRQFISELIEVRRAIEPMAAKLAAERATDVEIEKMTAAYDELERAAAEPSEIYIDVDIAFHETILIASHNDLLRQIAGAIRVGLRASREITIRTSSVKSLPYHFAVLEAIQNRDQEAAYGAMAYLIDQTALDIWNILEEAG